MRDPRGHVHGRSPQRPLKRRFPPAGRQRAGVRDGRGPTLAFLVSASFPTKGSSRSTSRSPKRDWVRRCSTLGGCAVLPAGCWPVGQPDHARVNVVEPINSRRTGPTPSKIRGPACQSDGLTQNQNSSTRPRVVSAWVSSPAPTAIRVRSWRSLRAVTLSAKSPSSRVAFQAKGPGRVRDRHVLGHAVHPVREHPQDRVVRQLRPDRSQSLVSLSPQHHRVRHQEQRDLIAVGIKHQPPIGLRHGRLECTVHRHGVVDGQSSHRGPPCRRAEWRHPSAQVRSDETYHPTT